MTTARRLLIVSQFYPPEIGAPQRRLSEWAEGLVELGWKVRVVTAQPNYPGGRIEPGYPRYRSSTEDVRGVGVRRVPMWPTKKGVVRRIVSQLTFMASALLFGGLGRWAAADAVLAETPPLFTALAGGLIARRHRAPLILNVSDLWPDSAVDMGIVRPGSRVIRVAQAVERRAYAGASMLTGQSDEIVATLAVRAPKKPRAVLLNGVSLARFDRPPPDVDVDEVLKGVPRPVFVYAGLLGYAQGLDQILDAAGRHRVNGTFVLVGEGPERERLERRVMAEGIRSVKVMPPIAPHLVPAMLRTADVALITLGSRITGAVPSKIYEAMAAGLPILFVGTGEGARRVREAGCGLVVEPGDQLALDVAVSQLVRDSEMRRKLGAAGRAAAERLYDRRMTVRTLDQLLNSVLIAS